MALSEEAEQQGLILGTLLLPNYPDNEEKADQGPDVRLCCMFPQVVQEFWSLSMWLSFPLPITQGGEVDHSLSWLALW